MHQYAYWHEYCKHRSSNKLLFINTVTVRTNSSYLFIFSGLSIYRWIALVYFVLLKQSGIAVVESIII